MWWLHGAAVDWQETQKSTEKVKQKYRYTKGKS